MAFTSVKPQAQVQAVLDTLNKAQRAMDTYILVNNPGVLSAADNALTVAVAAIAVLQGV